MRIKLIKLHLYLKNINTVRTVANNQNIYVCELDAVSRIIDFFSESCIFNNVSV